MANWAADTTSTFDFFKDAHDDLRTYLTTAGAPDNFTTYFTNTLTIRRTVFPEPYEDDSKSNFPIAHIWPVTFEAFWTTAGERAVKVTTRIMVWDEDNDPDVSGVSVKNLCGALASAIQQTRDTSGNTWADTYCNHDQPVVDVSEISYQEENQGLAQGQVNVTWSHKE